jgi:hypothetical protein
VDDEVGVELLLPADPPDDDAPSPEDDEPDPPSPEVEEPDPASPEVEEPEPPSPDDPVELDDLLDALARLSVL